MPQTDYAKLGWESRRQQILLPIPIWSYLDGRARVLGISVQYVIDGMVEMAVERHIARDRYSLTERGAATTEEWEGDDDDHKLGTGEARW